MKHAMFNLSDLRLCTLKEQFEQSEHLMRLANEKYGGARRIAELSLDRFFERIEEGLTTQHANN